MMPIAAAAAAAGGPADLKSQLYRAANTCHSVKGNFLLPSARWSREGLAIRLLDFVQKAIEAEHSTCSVGI